MHVYTLHLSPFSSFAALKPYLSCGQTTDSSTDHATHSEPWFVFSSLLCSFYCKAFPWAYPFLFFLLETSCMTVWDCLALAQLVLHDFLFAKSCLHTGSRAIASPLLLSMSLLVKWISSVSVLWTMQIYWKVLDAGIKIDSNTVTPLKSTATEKVYMCKCHKSSQGLSHEWLLCSQTAFSTNKLIFWLSFTYVRLMFLNYMQLATSYYLCR